MTLSPRFILMGSLLFSLVSFITYKYISLNNTIKEQQVTMTRYMNLNTIQRLALEDSNRTIVKLVKNVKILNEGIDIVNKAVTNQSIELRKKTKLYMELRKKSQEKLDRLKEQIEKEARENKDIVLDLNLCRKNTVLRRRLKEMKFKDL